jgi:hypothetical protein
LDFDDVETNCIYWSIFQILKGKFFSRSRFDIDLVNKCIKIIGLKFEYESNPENFDQALYLLIKGNCVVNHHCYQLAVPIVAAKFGKITSEQFSRLPIYSIENLLSSSYSVLPSENFLFNLIEKDHRRIKLRCFLIFPALDFEILKFFLQELKF